MEYPGNAALPEDIKERIVLTYQQTLESANQGRGNEALLGCDFILKLDPEFSPARELTRKLQADSAPPAADPGAEIEALVEARRFDEALELGRANPALVAGDPAIGALLGRAQELSEAAPYVASFLDSAEEAQAAGEGEQAAAHLDKARALDPDHPRLAELSKDPTSSSAFALDFDEPVTSFRLDGAPAEAEKLEETAPPAPPPMAPDDDPLAFLGQETEPADSPASPEAPAKIPDPFADLLPNPEGTADPEDTRAMEPPGSQSPDSAGDFRSTVGFDVEEGSDSGVDVELTDDEVEGDPFDLLVTDDEPSAEDGAGEDFGLGSGLGSDGGDRVQDLLNDGQAALDRGDPQGAIDAWSRIFLIDIDNEEASRRIEAARELKAESERAVEEVFHEGVDAWQAGDTEKARGSFERVLELQPGHAAAQENLEQLEAGGASPGAGPGAEGSAVSPSPTPPPTAGEDLLEEILVPPPPGEAAARPPARPAEEPIAKAGRAKGGGSRHLIIGLAVLVLVLAGGWYLFSNRSSLFPNNETELTAGSQAPRLTPIQRAEKLHGDGRKEQAVAQLKRVPATSPHHKRAQELITEWSLAEPLPEPALDPELATRREELLAEARARAAAGEFLEVRKALTEAAKIVPLSEEEAALETVADEHLQPLEKVFRQMEDREWSFALQDLWRQQVQDPQNPDVLRLIVDCYYNLGVRELQRGNQKNAVENFQEAVELAPGDPELARHLEFSRTYLERQEDLLYRIYVKYLPYRTT